MQSPHTKPNAPLTDIHHRSGARPIHRTRRGRRTAGRGRLKHRMDRRVPIICSTTLSTAPRASTDTVDAAKPSNIMCGRWHERPLRLGATAILHRHCIYVAMIDIAGGSSGYDGRSCRDNPVVT